MMKKVREKTELCLEADTATMKRLMEKNKEKYGGFAVDEEGKRFSGKRKRDHDEDVVELDWDSESE